MSQHNIIAKEDLDSFVERLFQERYNNWSDEVSIHGLPKAFDKTALRDLLLKLNEQTFKVLSKATGIAYLRNHETVKHEDCIAALKVKNIQTIDTILDTIEDA